MIVVLILFWTQVFMYLTEQVWSHILINSHEILRRNRRHKSIEGLKIKWKSILKISVEDQCCITYIANRLIYPCYKVHNICLVRHLALTIEQVVHSCFYFLSIFKTWTRYNLFSNKEFKISQTVTFEPWIQTIWTTLSNNFTNCTLLWRQTICQNN